MVHLDASDTPEFVVGVKNVLEDFLHGFSGARIRVQRNLVRPAKAQRPHVVQSQNVIGMGMRIENRVQPRDLLPYRLLAEVWRRINEDAMSVIFHHHRRPGTTVVRIVRCADAARAADRRHAHGSAAAQHGEHCLHFLIPEG